MDEFDARAGDALEPQFGVHTFGEVTCQNGTLTSPSQVLRDLVNQAVKAEETGLDFFGVGEHHRPDFAASQPEIILAAAAARTRTIKLGSAVTVISAHEPVFVYERFATLDALSGGRAELAVGAGAFPELFELIGGDFMGRQALFERRLADLIRLVQQTESTREPNEGPARAKLTPALSGGSLPVRVATSGAEGSFLRAAEMGAPVILAIREGDPARFENAVSQYRHRFVAGVARRPEVTLHVSGFIGPSLDEARQTAWPYVEQVLSTLGAERRWKSMTRGEFDELTSPTGSMLIGSAELVAEKIARWMKQLGANRFALKYGIGQMPHELLVENIERFGTIVAPKVKRMLE